MGKLREVKTKLKPMQVRQLKLPYPEVQASSLEEVVEYALQWLKERTDKSIMIEDSGLFIDALKGFPGVYSSYVYKWIGCRGMLKLMEKVKNRSARFEACAGLLIDGKTRILKGVCKGTIAHELRGKGGFGFDPIFIPQGHRRTFAEMGLDEKNEISHRARAIEKVARFLTQAEGV